MLFKTKTPAKDGKALKQSSNSIVGYLESLQLYYNANNELAKSIKTHRQGYRVTVTTTTYEYDAFGRRIAKHSEVQQQSTITFNNKRELKHGTVQHTPTQQQSTLMLWDGNRQAQEYTDTHIFTTIYEQNSFVPVARLVWLRDELLQSANDEILNAERESWEPEPKLIPSVQIYHYHNDHLGTPNELTSQDGEVVWLADYEAYGNTAKVVWREEQLGQLKVSAEELQPIRFQGQSFDVETGLHYNRFRYFDPDLGMFTTRDPIGLMGGNNVFQYAPNPIGWIDPWGLACSGISVYRVQGGVGENRSKELIKVDSRGNIKIKRGTLNVSFNNKEHASYFSQRRGPTSYIVKFEIPVWLYALIKESGIPQANAKSNPNNQGGIAPKIVDEGQPGESWELPEPWGKWLEEEAIPCSGKIIRN